MKIIGIGIDYSNICKDYNTVYLDRDNNDPASSQCMKQVLSWTNEFLSDFLEQFQLNIHNLSSDTSVNVGDIASKRFLFYSLEKEITLQSYVLHKEYTEYENLIAWELDNHDSILIRNDEDGTGISIFCNENSKEHLWINEKLKSFSLDEVSFEAK